MFVNGKVFKIFAKKPAFFNSCFTSQYTPVINKSQLLSLEFKANKGLGKITFTDDDTNFILKYLNTDKADGWNDRSIRMIKVCGRSIALPLRLIFHSIRTDEVFPDQNSIKNYQAISLLPIFRKVFERLIYNSLYN